MNICEEQTS